MFIRVLVSRLSLCHGLYLESSMTRGTEIEMFYDWRQERLQKCSICLIDSRKLDASQSAFLDGCFFFVEEGVAARVEHVRARFGGGGDVMYRSE